MQSDEDAGNLPRSPPFCFSWPAILMQSGEDAGNMPRLLSLLLQLPDDAHAE
jgi:hypothetical protein